MLAPLLFQTCRFSKSVDFNNLIFSNTENLLIFNIIKHDYCLNLHVSNPSWNELSLILH